MRISKPVKVAALAYAIFGMLTSSAEAAYHLTRANDSAPTPGLRFLPAIEGMRTQPPPRYEPLRATGTRSGPPVRIVEPVSRTSGSTNRFVDPWGCEASHAQQWSPSGRYWGKYQFDRQTWAAHGGKPSEYGSAPEAEQDRVAANVKYDAWPNC